MGAGLRQNYGLEWGPKMYTQLTSKTNLVYQEAARVSEKIASRDRKRKATSKAKENRRKSKYCKTDKSL